MTRPEASGGEVLIVLHESQLGGASRSVLQVARLMERNGWRFEFWVSRPSSLHDAVRSEGWQATGAPRHLRYRWSAWREPPGPRARACSIPGYFRQFHRLVRSRRFALVHANTLLTIPEAVIAHRAGQNTLVHVHEMLSDTLRGKAAARLLERTADVVIAVSEASQSSLERQSVRSIVIHEGTSIPPARPRREHSPLVVGTVGTVSRRKGTDLFVDAARAIRRSTPNVEFRIVGALAPGVERAWAKAVLDRAARNGLTHIAETDVFAEFASWDIFVLPSREDPFPLVILEAMASGLPVVATNVDGITEQVTPETGILVPSGQVGTLAAAIGDLLQRPLRRAELGSAARRRAVDLFTVERQAEKFEQLYMATLRQRRY